MSGRHQPIGPSAAARGKDSTIRCADCRGFFVTHDARRPWGCRIFGFSSPHLPSHEVFAVTGTVCAAFQQKAGSPPSHSAGRRDR
jgi:hypothetical protein